ncbi:Wadjet anti-phage system protein JetD domain-containing protein [Marisediminicola antarctica]|uniref:DUF3322 and DUF2220 domain-containing protein n=1 Tax=Marisediminicola antarctica TaxID=674079 RepID=A0A7L5AET6_9MICO|nr:Wadjet anti-phage system protein JetD domain-containing protein [Marisediminicola antarctica]QHO68938.1 hypothetical protein BHD05_04075 [Marisediminicola antarctica]
MRSIAEARVEARRIFDRNLGGWAWSAVQGEPAERIPLALNLQPPTGDEALDRVAEMREWSSAWHDFAGAGEVEFATRRFRYLGTQSVPVRLHLEQPAEVAAFIASTAHWRALVARLGELVAQWPDMSRPDAAAVRRVLDVPTSSWSHVVGFLRWSADLDLSELLPRQIAFPGVDSKWFDQNRPLLVALRAAGAGTRRLTTRQIDSRMLVRVLDPALRAEVGGLAEFAAPATELARLVWAPGEVIISENLQSAYSFGDRPGCVVLAAQGYAVEAYGGLPWLQRAHVRYWGDLDTHGFAILNRLRHHLPRVDSVLMDADTLLAHRSLWAREEKPQSAQLPLLTASEREAYEVLLSEPNARLEQERLPWGVVEAAFGVSVAGRELR